VTDYDFERKADGLKMIAEREGLELKHCVFVGDNDNDIEAIKAAGLGIAFSPKSDKVRQAADVIIDSGDMRDLLLHLT
jgi:hydroxymethylpyrimidine pyrophosphatase-like HAD family hydrolase